MKKQICLLLAVILLLCGCGNTAAEEEGTEGTAFVAEQPTVSATEPETEEEILAYRRDLVEAEMRRTMSVLWSPDEDISYSLNSASLGIETDLLTVPDKVMTLRADRIYQGLPYTHGSGSAYGFLNYASSQDENGVYTISGLGPEDLTGEANNSTWSRARIGCDCADTVHWAWAKVSNSISFPSTSYMTENYGCIKVGDYECNLYRYTSSTKPIAQANGTEVMYASYAQMQKGDAMVLYTDTAGGHAVMVVDVYVDDSEGYINGETSYVTIIEQTPTSQKNEKCYYNEEIGQNVYICGSVDTKWSFDTIYKKGYLPVTCQELIDASPRSAETVIDSNQNCTIGTLFNGTLTASYRIAYVTLAISDTSGKTVQQAICYGRQNNNTQFTMISFLDAMEQDVMQGSVDLSALTPGDYHCTVTCRLSSGNTLIVHDFDFTV